MTAQNNSGNRPKFRLILITALITMVVTAGVVTVTLSSSKLTGSGTTELTASASATDPPGHEGHNHDEDNPLWTCGMHPWIVTEEEGLCPICNMELTPMTDKGSSGQSTGEREVAYWKDPEDTMAVYRTRDDYTGDRELIPVYEDQLIGGVDISIDPVIEQNMGIRTAKVAVGPLSHSIRTYGNITWDETRTVEVNLKFSGWIEALYADYTGRQVTKGTPLFTVYSPELFAAQEEYLFALKSARNQKGTALSEIKASARRRLENFGIHDTEIRALENTRKISRNLIVRAPATGVITTKNITQGAFVKAGTRVFTISDLSRVWVEASIFEYEMGQLKTGLPAFLDFPYLPGQVFAGEVAYVYPYLNKRTRDVAVRLEFDNPDQVLKPDMYANVAIRTAPNTSGMIIDSEAVIRSGDADLVFVTKEKGRFIPRQVTLGTRLDQGKVEVISGLAPGETIVVSGQFLLDSESRLQETIRKMMNPEKQEMEPGSATGDDDFFNDMESDKKKSGQDKDGAEDFFDDMQG